MCLSLAIPLPPHSSSLSLWAYPPPPPPPPSRHFRLRCVCSVGSEEPRRTNAVLGLMSICASIDELYQRAEKPNLTEAAIRDMCVLELGGGRRQLPSNVPSVLLLHCVSPLVHRACDVLVQVRGPWRREASRPMGSGPPGRRCPGCVPPGVVSCVVPRLAEPPPYYPPLALHRSLLSSPLPSPLSPLLSAPPLSSLSLSPSFLPVQHYG